MRAPENASVVAEPVLFPDGGFPGVPGYTSATTGCHDITSTRPRPRGRRLHGRRRHDGHLRPGERRRYPCVTDPNFAFWHSATFNNAGTKVAVHRRARRRRRRRACNPTVGPDEGRGRDLRHPRSRRGRKFVRATSRSRGAGGHGELRGAQRVPDTGAGPRRHGPGLVPGRHVGVRLHRPGEAGKRSRGSTAGRADERSWSLAGNWSAYWYNGRIYSNEIQAGFDVLRLTGLAGLLSLTTRRVPYVNAQTQEPPSWW